MRSRKSASQKLTVVLLSVILVLCCTIGGTLAWLQDSTDTVTNTFTVGDVTLTLKESPVNIAADGTVTYDEPKENVANEYIALPGASYKKDPVVQVGEGNEKCYLFVKFEYTDDASEYYTYTSNLKEAEWTPLTSASATGTYQEQATTIKVWYRIIEKDADETDRTFHLLENDTLAVKNTVTNTDVELASKQLLKYTAYAVQYLNNGAAFTPDQAWDIAQDGSLS